MGNRRPNRSSATRKNHDQLTSAAYAIALLLIGAVIQQQVGGPGFGLIGVATAILLVAFGWWRQSLLKTRGRSIAVALTAGAYLVVAIWWTLTRPADDTQSRVQLAVFALPASNYPNPFAAGKPVAMNVTAYNSGPKSAREVYFYTKAYVAPANVLNGVSDVLVRVQRDFEDTIAANARRDYRNRRMGPLNDIPPGETRFGTIETEALSESQAAGFLKFDPLIVYVTIAFWRDDFGRVGELYDCRSLNPPQQAVQVDLVFRPCVPLAK